MNIRINKVNLNSRPVSSVYCQFVSLIFRMWVLGILKNKFIKIVIKLPKNMFGFKLQKGVNLPNVL